MRSLRLMLVVALVVLMPSLAADTDRVKDDRTDFGPIPSRGDCRDSATP